MNTEYNPFRISTIQKPEDFIGRKDVINYICKAMSSIQNVSLVAERRSGATSILRYLNHNDTSHKLGLKENHVTVYFDFQTLSGQATQFDFWYVIIRDVIRKIEQRKIFDIIEFDEIKRIMRASQSDENVTYHAIDEIFYLFEKLKYNIHFLLDEFETTSINPNFKNSFYQNLRSLLTSSGNISLVTATRIDLSVLEMSVADGLNSPLFNIFVMLNLGEFKEDEVSELESFSYDLIFFC